VTDHVTPAEAHEILHPPAKKGWWGRQSPNRQALVIIGGLTVVLAGFAGLSALGGSDQPTRGEDASAYVKVACRDWVKDMLKAPATADFTGEHVLRSGTTGYRVTGSVDSENGFGALIRTGFICEATHTGDTTSLVDITFR